MNPTHAPPATDRLHSSPTIRALFWPGGAAALLLALIGVVVLRLPSRD